MKIFFNVPLLVVACSLLILSGCKREKSEARAPNAQPKTSYGVAVSKAHEAARLTEDAQKRTMEEALGDDDKSDNAEK